MNFFIIKGHLNQL